MDDQALLASDGVYRQAMRAFATGVAIIACGRGVERAGCVATAVASLSLAPPSLIVNLQRDGSTYRRLRLSDGFSVNFLKPEQQARARGSKAPPARRRSPMRWLRSIAGSRKYWSATRTPLSSAGWRRRAQARG